MADYLAFVDESLRVADGIYILAAVIAQEDLLEDVREGMRSLLRGREKRCTGATSTARSSVVR